MLLRLFTNWYKSFCEGNSMQMILNSDQKKSRQFGLLMAFLILILTFLIEIASLLVLWLLYGAAGLLLCAAIFFPSSLTSFTKVWIRFGYAIGRVVNPIVLLCVYVLMFVFYGFLIKLFRSDPLFLKKQNMKTYWINESDNKKPNFEKMF